MIDYRQKSIYEFKQITNFDLSGFLYRTDDFFRLNYPKIRDWYKGVTNSPDVYSFKVMKRLMYESSVVLELFQKHKTRFDKSYFWELLENIEEINIRLLDTSNLSKFLRSSRSKNSYLSGLKNLYTLKKYDTLESIQRQQIALSDFDNQWINIALENDLLEEQYDEKGGNEIVLRSTFQSIFLNSIVDNLEGDKLYGLDLNKKLTFINDDLEVLDYRQTAVQDLEILISITKGSVPEFPTLGVDESLVVGSNRGNLTTPIIQRDLLNVFNTDDSFKDFKITSISFEQDSFLMSFTVKTVRGDLIDTSANITQ